MLKRDSILPIGLTMVTKLRQHNSFSSYLEMDINARNMGTSTSYLHLTLFFRNSWEKEFPDSKVILGVTGGRLELIAEPAENCYFEERPNGWCTDFNNLKVEPDFKPNQASWRFQSTDNSWIVNEVVQDAVLVYWHNSPQSSRATAQSSRATAKFMVAKEEIQVCVEKRDINTNQWVSIGDGNDVNKQFGIKTIFNKDRLAGGFSLVTLEVS